MKKGILLFFAVVWLSMAFTDKVQAAESVDEIAVTQINQIMIAQEDFDAKEVPDDSSTTVYSYNSGDPVLVAGETENGWYQVVYQGQKGYVHKTALIQSTDIDAEAFAHEMEENQAESKMMIEEVERYRAEVKRSRIWGTVIVLLVIGIFVTGIVSGRKTGEIKETEEMEEAEGVKETDIQE